MQKCVYCELNATSVSPFCVKHLLEWGKKWRICRDDSCWGKVPIMKSCSNCGHTTPVKENYFCEKHTHI